MTNLPVFREIFTGVARFTGGVCELAAQLRAGLTKPDTGAQQAGPALAVRYTWSAAAPQHLARYQRRTEGAPASR